MLNYVVGGNGTVQSVQVGSTFAGTPTGTLRAGDREGVRFPAFKRARKQFNYLFFLRAPAERGARTPARNASQRRRQANPNRSPTVR